MKPKVTMRHIPRKRFGQNFLIDEHIIDHIIALIAPQQNEHFVEIGPGKGALTQKILPHVASLDVVELDRDLVPLLQKKCPSPKLSIFQADALTFDFHQLKKTNGLLRIIGNLPYNISTPLLFHLLGFTELYQDMFFMLQKEVVNRLAATPATSAYGRLSVMIQYHCQVFALLDVAPSAFYPVPEVDSAIVRLLPYKVPPFIATSFSTFTDIVRTAFNQRRKTISNSLKTWATPAIFIKAGINPQQRPEELSVENYVQLANIISQNPMN